MSYPFTRLSSAVVAHALCPFLTTGDLVRFFNTNKLGAREQLDTIREAVEQIMYSRISIFGQVQYWNYWRLKITDQFEPGKISALARRTFLEIYYGPNPVDPTQGVKNTCLIPTVVPSWAIFEDRGLDVNLNLLGLVAEYPRFGYAAKYMFNSPALQLYGEDIPDEEAHLEIVLIGVVGRNVSWEGQVQCLKALNDRTGYGCDTRPGVRSLTAATLAHYVVTRERAFGDEEGLEGCHTFSRTQELVAYKRTMIHVGIGDFGSRDDFDYSGPGELIISDVFHDAEHIGIAVSRKIYNHN